MSDFISRVAARAVGTPPVARPRLPPFFGEHPPPADDVEIVQERVVAPAPARMQVHAEPAPHERSSEPVADAEPPATEAPRQRIEVAASAREESVRVVERTTTRAREIAQPVHVAPPPETRHELVLQQAAPILAVQATPVVVEAERAAAVPAPKARAEDVPSVRVHIGRLEVRANLQQAPPQRPRRAEPRAQELTLSDYLRGKREAG